MKQQSILILAVFIPFLLLAQETQTKKKRKDVLLEKGLTRSSLDYSLFTVLAYDGDNTILGGMKTFWGLNGGSAFRFSSNYYLTPDNKNRIYFRANWIRLGLAIGDGILFPSAPLNIGLGDNIKINENVNIDFTLSGGLVLVGPGFMEEYIEPIFAVYPEVQLQLKRFSFGFTYSQYAERFTSTASFYHYIGFMMVQRLR